MTASWTDKLSSSIDHRLELHSLHAQSLLRVLCLLQMQAAVACQATDEPDEDDGGPAKAPSEYELERQANIQRNRQRLAELAGASGSP